MLKNEKYGEISKYVGSTKFITRFITFKCGAFPNVAGRVAELNRENSL
jgi:hypothetical protein